MASIFTYQEEPHRVHSPWSTPGSSTPQIAVHVQSDTGNSRPTDETIITKLEPEKHDGPIEYKLHLLLRWRRTFTHSSTTSPSWVSQQAKADHVSTSSPHLSDLGHTRASYQPSNQNRQARLQQLTTQLLWRLQQSSPFHSSSNAKLVLPILPEATPRLGIPDRPSKLLPGLEESQGALYEIGVADDGTLVGLADEELEESLTNLRAMAASLGCVVDLHRRVIVGDCEWIENDAIDQTPITRTSKLWVAEVLVRPDNKNIEIVPADTKTALQTLDLNEDATGIPSIYQEAPKEYLRVVLVGATAAGKSSLLGTLTTSVLDNGRGKSRISLLKHRHEISSGITSSVAQELLGYDRASNTKTPVINYATGDVSSWPDIHNLADRLVFLSDSPGLPRYSKSAFRALISWKPSWAVLCIPADEQPPDSVSSPTTPTVNTPPLARSVGTAEETSLSLAYLELCLKVRQPFIVAITKMDLATKSSLRRVLADVLSAVKRTGRTPSFINATNTQGAKKDEVDFAAKIGNLVTVEQDVIERELASLLIRGSSVCVPIVMTSAVSGLGIPSIHAILRALPHTTDPASATEDSRGTKTIFRTDEVFAIPPSKVYSTSCERITADSGIVLCGLMDTGTIALGDSLLLGPFLPEQDHDEPSGRLTPRRASSHNPKSQPQSLPRSLSETFSKSLHLNGGSQAHSRPDQDAEATFVKVRVVSLRNLRLPVTAMRAGDTGTVGIQLMEHGDSNIALNKARKGMVLTRSLHDQHPKGYRSFSAYFPYSDFGTSASPPLILGGHAIVYINSIRAAVKVTAVAISDAEDSKPASSNGSVSHHDEVFLFDDDDKGADEQHEANGAGGQRSGNFGGGYERQDVKITFRFVSTVEFLEVNDQVLVVPNLIMAGPVAGPVVNASISGLSGFVGRISEMYP